MRHILLSVCSRLRSAGLILCLASGLWSPSVGYVHAVSVEVWYSPVDEPLRRVAELYGHAKRYVFVPVYGLTSLLVVKPLVAAAKRGVDVRVITDRGRGDDAKQRAALSALHQAGIPIKVNRHDGLMHLEQVAIDDEINTNGSMSHATSENRYNDERLDIIRDHALTVQARAKFMWMWKDDDRFEDWK